MILIFGGRHDPNIAVLADRLAARGMPFVDLRIGAVLRGGGRRQAHELRPEAPGEHLQCRFRGAIGFGPRKG